MGERELLAQVRSVADALEAGDFSQARLVLDVLEAASAAGRVPEARLARLFAAALRVRLAGGTSGGGNLYLAEPGEGVDMIGAFDALVSATPFIRFAYAAANSAILEVDAAALHLIDVGIGEGTQWPPLFDALARRSPNAHVRLTGVDVPSPGEDPEARLRAVGARLRDEAARHGLTLQFRGIAAPMEDVTRDDLDLRDEEYVVVNLALALHHTSTGTGGRPSARDEVVARLHALSPALVTLVEPDSEHDRLPFRPRVDEALAHYGAIFRALDALLPPRSPARAVLEEQFFGREIINVVAFEGEQRVERHHRHEVWGDRFRRAGFRVVDLAPHAASVGAAAGVSPPAAVTADDGMLVLTWDGTPLLSASAWTP